MIQANAASVVDQFKVAQDRTPCSRYTCIYSAAAAGAQGNMGNKMGFAYDVTMRPSIRTQHHRTTNANGTPEYVKPVPLPSFVRPEVA